MVYFTFNFRIVPHSEIDPKDHYTISLQGVTHNTPDEVEFTKLSRWEKEYKDYQRLIKIPSFANFRKWKAFYVWRKNVRGKYVICDNFSFTSVCKLTLKYILCSPRCKRILLITKALFVQKFIGNWRKIYSIV